MAGSSWRILLVLTLGVAGSAMACPSCGAAVQASGDDVPKAINTSVLFMLSMPFVLLGLFSGAFYLMIRHLPKNQIPGDDA